MTVATPLGNPALHFTLTQMAARAAGVDLSEALGDGRLSGKAHAEMITRCRGCHSADVCETQLAMGIVPKGCPNAAAFGKLAAAV